MVNRQSQTYGKIFHELGIGYELGVDRETVSTTVLGQGGQSLRLFFVEASRNHDAFFSANIARYRDFIAKSERWEFVGNVRTPKELDNKNCDTVRPKPGREKEALKELLQHVRSLDES